MTTARTDFSLNNLTSNPCFDVVNNICEENDISDSENFVSDSPYQTSNFYCSYVDPLVYKQNIGIFSIMTLNIQCLTTKFGEFKELISILVNNKCAPDIICLQELWQFPKMAVFSLPGYSPLIYKLRGGGVRGGCWVFH